MIKQLNELKTHVLICLTIILVTTIAGASLVFFKVTNFSYERGDTKIAIENEIAEKVINHDEYSNEQLKIRIGQLERAIAENNNTPIEVIRAVEELKPTADETIKNSEKLQEIIEEATEEWSE